MSTFRRRYACSQANTAANGVINLMVNAGTLADHMPNVVAEPAAEALPPVAKSASQSAAVALPQTAVAIALSAAVAVMAAAAT